MSEQQRDRRGHRRIGTILLIVGALLMVVPIVGATGLLQPSSGGGAVTPTPLVVSGTSCAVSFSPEFAAYDPANHYTYVPDFGGANLSILSNGCKLVASIAFTPGSEPYSAAFNPANNRVYVTDYYHNEVYVISGTTWVHNITSRMFDNPFGIAYDPADNSLAVSNFNGDTVSFISDFSSNPRAGTFTLGTVTGTTSVGQQPELFGYDPSDNRLLVSNSDSENVTSMNASNPTDAADDIAIPTGYGPGGIAYDPADQWDYVTNTASNSVSIITGTGGQVYTITYVRGTTPTDTVWDQTRWAVLVVNQGASSISVIRGYDTIQTINGPSGTPMLTGISYDDATSQVYVTASDSAEVYIYN
jgi:DNA-binding beta-propeller fold protein YncE